MTSLYKISEMVASILGKDNYQEIIETVKGCYATVAKASWYEGKQNDCGEIDGSFIYTFKDNIPVLDEDQGFYYITIPSAYLVLPHEFGVNQVSYMKSQNSPMVRIGNGQLGLYSGLKSFGMGGSGVFYIDGSKIYFPKMDGTDNKEILLKLAIALDLQDVDEEINIAPNMVEQIVNMAVQKFAGQAKEQPATLNP